ncbi:MAG: aminoacyl-tRNA hydrolase [Alphaproteobacteria bacterium]|nr:aminoacyl-tRNA hydrolase [Alphaproteobacteria bacterium]MBV9540993.1 aminoacyl-tRNA hydrolase [Alphaproteobacteria bacterium]MBV9905431.1 aminoacyl-tRNA hydrolase [Alphaproteobacteria bacterium]
MSDTPLLIAGLGNPGAEYARNRHNAGFMAVDTIHASYNFGPWRARFQGATSEGALNGRRTILLKPGTYMNESGRSLRAAVDFYKLPLSAVVVMHDELDLPAAKLKVKTGGGDAGNNGAKSITAALGPDYRRVRIGIGHPGERGRVHGHVLGNFTKADEKEWLVPMLTAIAEAAPLLAKDNDIGFMNKIVLALNPPRPNAPKPPPKVPAAKVPKAKPEESFE